jgi:peptidoglycan/xylan/chitin deacetylase (PgdA/CDA1 family)
VVKGALRFALWAAQADRIARLLRPDSVAVFMYHGVSTSAEALRRGDRLAPEELDRQLAWLSAHMEVRPLREWVGRPLEGRSRPGAAITFDDGLRSVLTHARPILAQHACPATVFLCPGLIERDELPWFERLYRVLSVSGKMEIFQSTSELLKTLPAQAQDAAIEVLRRELGIQADESSDEGRLLSWDEIAELGRDGLVDFGAHTMNHRILSLLTIEEQREEIVRSREEVARRAGSCALFAYPNGKRADFTTATAELVRAAGFTCAVTAIPGLIRPGADPFLFPRIAVGPRASRAHFALRASGWIGERG